MGILWNHFRRLPPELRVREFFVPGFIGPIRMILSRRQPSVEEVGHATLDYRETLVLNEGNPDMVTTLDANLLGSYADCYNESVDIRTQRTNEGGLLDYRRVWRQNSALEELVVEGVPAPARVQVTVEDVQYPAIVKLSRGLGSSPDTAVCEFPTLTPQTAPSVEDWRGAVASVQINDVTVMSGYLYISQRDLKELVVTATILDVRHLLNKTYIGARHLGTNGLPVIGADITFNLNGKRNRATVLSAVSGTGTTYYDFSYTQADGGPLSCSLLQNEWWTYADILKWIWVNYVDDIPMPTIPTTGGLSAKAVELDLFGMPVGDAIDRVLSFTPTQWRLNSDGTATFFSRAVPAGTQSIILPDMTNPLPAADYTMDYPVEIGVSEDCATIVTDMDLIGGRSVREIMLTAADFVQGSTYIEWGNYDQFLQPNYHPFYFDPSRYETHNAGKNIRFKDIGLNKPFLSHLNIKRREDGTLILQPDSPTISGSECGIHNVSSYIQRGNWPIDYPWEFDWERGLYKVGPLGIADARAFNAPDLATVAILLETRENVSCGSTIAELPAQVKRAVIRNDLAQQSREALWYPYLWNPTGIPDPETSTTINPKAPGYIFLKIPANDNVFDASAALGEIGNIVGPEIARPMITVTGKFPGWKALNIGDKIVATNTTVATAYGMSGLEIILSSTFNSETQETEFMACNYISTNVSQLAEGFIDRRLYN